MGILNIKSQISKIHIKIKNFAFCIVPNVAILRSITSGSRRVSRKVATFGIILIFAFCILHFLTGCAEIKPPSPEEIMRQPLGKGPLRIGMTKEKVKSLWGEPDVVRVLGTDSQGMVREEWIYRGRYPNLPINVGYLSETQHLFFDGDNLMKFYHQK